MDVLRKCYTTDMRFFVDNPLTIPVRWYFAAKDAKWFPKPNKFSSGNYASDAGPWGWLGEVQDAPRIPVDGSPPPFMDPPVVTCPEFSLSLPDTLYLTLTEVIHPDIPQVGVVGTKWRFDRLFPGSEIYEGPTVVKIAPAGQDCPLELSCSFGRFTLTFSDDGFFVGAQSELTDGQHFAGPVDAFFFGTVYPGVPLNTDAWGRCAVCGMGRLDAQGPWNIPGVLKGMPDDPEQWVMLMNLDGT